MDTFIQGITTHMTHISPWIIYLWFFLSAILQITFPPYPGDTILILGGYLGSAGVREGSASILGSYLVGTIISSFALYTLGSWKGEAVLKTRLVSKYFSQNHQLKAKKWLLRYGIVIFFICKFIPGLNSLIIIFGGIFRFNPLWAYIGVGIASIIHNVIFFLLGRSIGHNLESIKGFLSTYNVIVISAVILAAGVYQSTKIYKSKKNKKNAEK